MEFKDTIQEKKNPLQENLNFNTTLPFHLIIKLRWTVLEGEASSFSSNSATSLRVSLAPTLSRHITKGWDFPEQR